MVVSFTVDRTRRSLNFRGVSGSIPLEKYIFGGCWQRGPLAAAIVIAAALWFLNRSVKLKEGTKAGRFLFGKEIEYGAVVER